MSKYLSFKTTLLGIVIILATTGLMAIPAQAQTISGNVIDETGRNFVRRGCVDVDAWVVDAEGHHHHHRGTSVDSDGNYSIGVHHDIWHVVVHVHEGGYYSSTTRLGEEGHYEYIVEVTASIDYPGYDFEILGLNIENANVDSGLHSKCEGIIIPLEETPVLLTHVSMTIKPHYWMCMVDNFDFHVKNIFTIKNPTTEEINVTIAFPFSTHDIYGDYEEFETISISQGDTAIDYSVALNKALYTFEDGCLCYKGEPINCPVHPLLLNAHDMSEISVKYYNEGFEMFAFFKLSFQLEPWFLNRTYTLIASKKGYLPHDALKKVSLPNDP